MISQQYSFPLENSVQPLIGSISAKVATGQRISNDEAMYLYEEASLGQLAQMAEIVRQRKAGNNVYFNRNFHLEPTNVCIYSCAFCSYSRLIKERTDGWELSMDDMMDIVKKYDDQPVTEIHIVGGVMPQYDVQFYSTLFSKIKAHRPSLHVKALTPVEYHYIFKKAKISYDEGMRLMMDAGLDSIPGGGAEIFHPEIREQIAGDKCTGQQWLDMHRSWHKIGGRSNATMLYGHIEKFEHRIDHMDKLRQLQDETGGFQTFIPLKFLNENNEMSHIKQSSVLDDMRNYAVARIYLDNFDHLKAYWPMLGRDMAQMSLSFGVDDLDGTIDDTTKIYSMAGSVEQNPNMSTLDLVTMIDAVHRQAIERDTLYNVVKSYTKEDLVDEKKQYDYYSLPVVNNN